jgi:hypothetical protein
MKQLPSVATKDLRRLINDSATVDSRVHFKFTVADLKENQIDGRIDFPRGNLMFDYISWSDACHMNRRLHV